MSREDPQMKIRLPEALREQIAASAKATGRSLNAEIVARLGASFAEGDDRWVTIAQAREMMDEMIERAVRKTEAAMLVENGLGG